MKRSSRIVAMLICGVLPISLAPKALAQTASSPILYYEPIDIELVRDTGSQVYSPAVTASAEISAFGRRFAALLSGNRALTRNLPAETRASIADIDIWEGTLDGIPNAWIRLVQRGTSIFGSFSDGVTTYAIGPFDQLQDRLVAPDAADAGRLIVYPHPGIAGPFLDLVVASESAMQSMPSKDDVDSGQEAKPALEQGLEAEIAVAADAEFGASYGASAELLILDTFNAADAIFVQQIGLHLTLSELTIYRSEPDPFNATDATNIVLEFENFATNTEVFRQADLSHLFTGRPLGYGGIANYGPVCVPGVAVGVTSSLWGAVTAHEIAHNFTVFHDDEPAVECQTPTGFLMNSSGGSDRFSTCSISVLRQTIARASCLSPVPDSDLVVSVASAPVEVLGISLFEVDVRLDSVGIYESLAVELAIESPSARLAYFDYGWEPQSNTGGLDSTSFFGCDINVVPVVCSLPRIPANGSFTFKLFFNAIEAEDVSIGFDAWSLNDSDPGNNDSAVTVNVVPAIDLNASINSALATPSQPVAVNVSLSNNGLIEATNVEVKFNTDWSLFEFISADLPGGAACVPSADADAMICPIGDIPVGEVLQFAFMLRALDPGSPGNYTAAATLELSAAEPDSGHGVATSQLRLININADLRVSITGPATTELDDEATFTLTVENLGPDPAVDMTLWISSPGLSVSTSTLDLDTCSLFGGGWYGAIFVVCSIPGLNAGESASFSFGGTASGTGTSSVEASLSAPAIEPDLTNNSAALTWTVTASSPSPVLADATGGGGASGGSSGSGNLARGGGGGAMDPLWLLLLGLCALGLPRRARYRV